MHSDQKARRAVFALEGAVGNPFAKAVIKAAAKPLGKALGLEALAKRYQSLPEGVGAGEFLEAAISAFGFECDMPEGALECIPLEGPVMVVANHPFGGLEGLLLARMLLAVRPDVRIMANHLLGRIEELRELFILVDPFGTGKALARNIAPLRESMSWLRAGGCLGVFPAGEVAHYDLRQGRVVEPRWSPSVARIVKACGASVVPVRFSGANGPLFHLAGIVHPRLRTVLLGREFVNKTRKKVEARMGRPIPASRLEGMSDEQAAGYLRLHTEVLGGGPAKPWRLPVCLPVKRPVRLETLAAPKDPGLMASEVDTLPESSLLLASGAFEVREARARQIPLVLKEIGRLRELSFRKVGEGTGKALDLDAFDEHYSHVFIWNSDKSEVVGAYRLGRTDEILAAKGPSGLYVNTLFKLGPGFLRELGPSLEMGRSFVRPEYQKSYNALLLLWRGIGTVVAREPWYRRLFGPVSITNEYQAASRQLIAGYFESSREKPELARMVKPRTPFKGQSWIARAAGSLVSNVESLSELVSAVEADRKGIPVLLRQYLKLGGKLLAFNVDRAFKDALDGLMVVDLLETDSRQLERYLGKEGLAGFLAYHQEGWKRSA